MRREDPLPRPQLAIPVAVVKKAFETAQKSNCPKTKATADLIIIAFYYLLRVGEYTKPRYKNYNGKRIKSSRTVQFSVKDVGFHKDTNVLDPAKISSDLLLECTSATMRIGNQKNGRMGQTIHQEAIKDVDDGPTQAMARRISQILADGGNGDTLICDYKTTLDGPWLSVTANDIISMVRDTVKSLNLHRQGIDPDLVGAHSLRAGGAVALKLHGYSDTTIMKQGRWSGLTFLMYIHNQIAHLSHDLSQKMSTELPFINIAKF